MVSVELFWMVAPVCGIVGWQSLPSLWQRLSTLWPHCAHRSAYLDTSRSGQSSVFWIQWHVSTWAELSGCDLSLYQPATPSPLLHLIETNFAATALCHLPTIQSHTFTCLTWMLDGAASVNQYRSLNRTLQLALHSLREHQITHYQTSKVKILHSIWRLQINNSMTLWIWLGECHSTGSCPSQCCDIWAKYCNIQDITAILVLSLNYHSPLQSNN